MGKKITFAAKKTPHLGDVSFVAVSRVGRHFGSFGHSHSANKLNYAALSHLLPLTYRKGRKGPIRTRVSMGRIDYRNATHAKSLFAYKLNNWMPYAFSFPNLVYYPYSLVSLLSRPTLI